MKSVIVIVISLVAGFAVSCSQQETKAPATVQNTNLAAAPPQASQSSPDAKAAIPQRTPATGITAADIAKVKWLEGSWRGTGADKPFFNRYHFTATTLDIQSFDDEAMTKKADSPHYELKDGMFQTPEGKDRFAASEITPDYIQFVTLTGQTAAFKMERVGDGTVKATIEWTGADGNPDRKSYILEPLKK